MSYDILLYPRTAGQSWEEVLAADEEEADDTTLEDETALEQGVATFRRIETRLREVLAGDVETWVAEETGGDVYGELSAPDTGLQVELYAGSAAVSFPYWEHADLDAFHAQVRQAVRIVAEETGYEAFDPQTDAAFDGTFDDEVGREATRRLAEDGEVEDREAGDREAGNGEAGDREVGDGEGPSAAGIAAGDAARRAGAPAVDPRQDPAFLRRRGRLYVVIGVVLTLFGVWRLTNDGSGWLTWLVLAIGVLDLLGGLFMLSLARQSTPTTEGPTTEGPTTEGPPRP